MVQSIFNAPVTLLHKCEDVAVPLLNSVVFFRADADMQQDVKVDDDASSHFYQSVLRVADTLNMSSRSRLESYNSRHSDEMLDNPYTFG